MFWDMKSTTEGASLHFEWSKPIKIEDFGDLWYRMVQKPCYVFLIFNWENFMLLLL